MALGCPRGIAVRGRQSGERGRRYGERGADGTWMTDARPKSSRNNDGRAAWFDCDFNFTASYEQ